MGRHLEVSGDIAFVVEIAGLGMNHSGIVRERREETEGKRIEHLGEHPSFRMQNVQRRSWRSQSNPQLRD